MSCSRSINYSLGLVSLYSSLVKQTVPELFFEVLEVVPLLVDDLRKVVAHTNERVVRSLIKIQTCSFKGCTRSSQAPSSFAPLTANLRNSLYLKSTLPFIYYFYYKI